MGARQRELQYLGYYIYNRTQEQQNKTNVVKIVLFIIENVSHWARVWQWWAGLGYPYAGTRIH
jgi:hypothetical protein